MEEIRPLIGVITARACASEQRQLLCGIITQAQKMNADTAIFSNIYNDEQYHAGVEIENKIYDLLSSPRLCGLILTAESFLNEDLKKQLHENLAKRKDIPVIVTGADIPGFSCINTDVMADVAEITRHLTDVHHFTEIDLLTGPANLDTSMKRVEGYRKALTRAGVPFDEHRVIYGNFWMNSGEALAKEYISGKRTLPQGIICANDYMAYGLCDVFLAEGISVPQDVTVMGYEYVGDRIFHAPILSTFRRNRFAVGQQAVRDLFSRLDGKKRNPLSLAGELICGDSCTCGVDRPQLCRELETTRNEQFYSLLNLEGNMEQQLAKCRNVTEYVRGLQQFAYLIRGSVGLYLCLYEDWFSHRLSEGSSTHGDTMLCYPVICPGDHLADPAYYSKSTLYPDVIPPSKTCIALYFCPIFFSGRDMGYFIIQYNKPDTYDMIFRDWLKIASNALETLRMKNDIRTLLECQQLSEHHDSVTGLPNQRGMEKELQGLLHHAEPDECILMLLIRTGLSEPSGNIPENFLSLEMETAQAIRRLSGNRSFCCGKLSDNLFCLAGIGNFPESCEILLADQLRILIGHSPAHQEYSGLSPLFIRFTRVPAAEFSFPEAVSELKEKIEEEIRQYTQVSAVPDFHNLRQLRSELYRNPQLEWDAEKACRDFLLSAGHFRAKYKEVFGISFHKDVIRSRISLAKYLLLTTSLNTAVIAQKCGYEDNKYFLRQFRQLTGQTPQQYRSSLPS